MPNSNDQDRKKLSLSGRGKLSLSKTVETSQVRQSFSHGRSKTVQVEVRRPTRVKKPVVLGAKEAPKGPQACFGHILWGSFFAPNRSFFCYFFGVHSKDQFGSFWTHFLLPFGFILGSIVGCVLNPRNHIG